jgi:hypothetical protein
VRSETRGGRGCGAARWLADRGGGRPARQGGQSAVCPRGEGRERGQDSSNEVLAPGLSALCRPVSGLDGFVAI